MKGMPELASPAELVRGEERYLDEVDACLASLRKQRAHVDKLIAQAEAQLVDAGRTAKAPTTARRQAPRPARS
jgi:hypothetical protein